MVMSWGNFEELKKFSRKHGTIKKKIPTVGCQNLSANKRRKTDNGSLSFVSNIESGEIEGFSTDEEKDYDGLEGGSDSLPKNLPSKPFVKRKYSKRQTLPDKRSCISLDCTDQKGKELRDFKSCDHELMKYAEADNDEIEIVSSASDDEELPQVFLDGYDSDDSKTKFPSKQLGLKSSQGSATATGINDGTSASVEIISDFQSDQESIQESLSADISTPTPTPVSPVVVGTPRTASEWLQHVQHKSPQKSEDDKFSESGGAGMNQWDSAKKKRKFVRSGLAEQLKHIISREKSEKAFWNHRVTDTDNKTTGASPEMDGSVTMEILCNQLQGSLHLTQCCMLCKDSNRDPQQRLVIVLFTCETWKQLALEVGATVNIYPPWQKLDIPGVPCPVLLCTYFCDKQPTDQSPAVQLQSVKGSGLLIPLLHTSPSTSSLLQSPQKRFKPSKLLFGSDEDTSMVQTKLASSSLTTVAAAANCPGSTPHTSILNAIESSGEYSGALVTIQCLVQRVYCKKVQLARDNKDINRCTQLLNQHIKYAAKGVDEVEQEELRWTLLVQDIHGMCAEIQVPPKYYDSLNWISCLQQGEGKVFTFSQVRVHHRTNRIRSPGLFSVIQSLWSACKADNTVTSHNGSSQIVTQESDSQASNSGPSPNFCYSLSVQESSQACEDDDVSSSGFLYKPCAFRALWNVLHEKEVEVERISALCQLLYCRLNGSSAVGQPCHSTFELFVIDSSLLSATELSGSTGELLPYMKIVGKSCHVLPKELKEARANYGTILSAKHLLLKVQAYQELVADTYSVIRKAVPEFTTIARSTFLEDHVPQDTIDSMSCLKPASLPCLTRCSCNGYLYRVQGVVIGVDEESACCWLVCDTCGNTDITVKQGTSSQFFCSLCNGPVNSPRTRTHLAVLVKVESFPEASVKVMLQQNTIDKLLPVSYQDSDQGYDIEAVLGKQLKPMNCYVTERSEHQDGTSYSFSLEEIHIT